MSIKAFVWKALFLSFVGVFIAPVSNFGNVNITGFKAPRGFLTNPPAPLVGTITQPTCTVATGSVVLSGLPAIGTWTINPGTITGTGTSTTITGIIAGATYKYTVTDAGGLTSPPSADVVINAQPITPSIPVVVEIYQPICEIITGSVFLSGLPATGTWILTRNPGAVTMTGTGTSATVSGLPAPLSGALAYSFTVTNSEGCTSPELNNVLINAKSVIPDPPVIGNIIQPTCTSATGSVELLGLPTINLFWILTRYPGAVTLIGNSASTIVTGLPPNTYTFTVSNGCVSMASASVVINPQPTTPTAPVVGTITQPYCAITTGSVILSGLPDTGTWTLIRNPGAVTSTGTGTSTTLTGLPANSSGQTPYTYTFTVTNAGGCISPASADILINNLDNIAMTPGVGTITQPTCSLATGSVVLSGLPATGTWTLTRNPGAVTSTGTGTSTTVSGLTPNTYIFTVTYLDGCTGPASAPVLINTPPASPPAPIVGAITQPTCVVATGSVVLSGLPATGTWTINPGAITGTGTSTTITGIPAGSTNTYTVTNADGCTSPASANVVINPQPTTPTAPIVGIVTQATCTVATGSVVLSGLPATGTWTINPGAITGTGTSTTITGITAGATYTYTVTNADGCTSPASGNVVINPQPINPSAPIVGTITHPTCTVITGSVVLSGLPATGTWTINPGAITGTGTSTTISGIPAGTTNTYTVTNAAGCTSVVSASVVINVQPNTPTAPVVGAITQPTCTLATGSVVLSGLPATGTWTINPGAISGTGISTTITGIPAGSTNTYTVTNAAGCTSMVSASVVINVQPNTPTAPVVGAITQPTCTVATGSVVLSGLPATDTWTINPGGLTGSGTTTTISGIAAGTSNTYTVTNAAGCTSVASASVVINNQPTLPVTSVISGNITPACSATGITYSVVLTAGSSYAWTVPSGSTITAGNNGPGNNQITVSFGTTNGNIAVIETNAGGCLGTQRSLAISLIGCGLDANFSGSPMTLCQDGSVTFTSISTGATGSTSYNWDFGAGASPATANTIGPHVVTYATPGSKTVSLIITDGASNTETKAGYITVNASATAPLVGAITQPTCTVSTARVVLSGLPATGTWTINPGAISGTGTSTTITGVPAGSTNTYTVTNATGCISAASASVVINDQPALPSTSVISGNNTPACSATGITYSVVLTAGSSYAWTVPSGSTITAGNTGPGNNQITVSFGTTNGNVTVVETNADGCIGAQRFLAVSMTGCGLDANFTGMPLTLCQDETVTFTNTSTGTTGSTTYSWDFGPGASPATANTIGPHVVTYVTAGSKTVSLIISEGGLNTETKADYITVNTLATAPMVGIITQPTCTVAIGSVVLSGLPASGTWIINPGAIIGSGTSATITGIPAGSANTYTVTNDGGCTSPTSESVVINNQPTLPVTSFISGIESPDCSENGIAYSVVLTEGSSYAWTVPPGATITTGNTGPDNNQISVNFGTTNGNVTVVETNAAGCIGTRQSLTISLQGCGLDADFSGSPLSICQGATVTFTNISTGTTGSTTFNWDFGAGASPATANTIGPHVITYATVGSKTITLTISDGILNIETKTDYITVSPSVTIAAFSPAASTRCQGGGTNIYSTTASNFNEIIYTLDQVSLAAGNIIDGATGEVVFDPAWFGTTMITASASGCNGPVTTNHIITITPPDVPVFATIGPLQQYSTPPPLVAKSVNNITGTWNPSFINTSEIGTSTYAFNPDPGQCAIDIFMEVEIINSPCPDVNLGEDIEVCSKIPITLTGDDGTGETYLWSRIENSVAVIIGTTATVLADRTADYILSVTKNICTITDTVNVKILDPQLFGIDSISKTDNVCFDGQDGSIEIYLHGTSTSYQYSIDQGEHNQNTGLFENLRSGDYIIRVSEDSTCFIDYSVPVVIGPPDSIHIVPHIKSPRCPTCSEGRLTLEISGGWGGYRITLSGIPVELVTEGLTVGVYTIEVTDSKGCKKTLDITVEGINIPNVITTNGDGLNDLWKIPILEYYPDVIVRVITVTGKVVFESVKGYPVPWDGKSNGNPLASGTYYYLINLGLGEEQLTGYLTILR